MHYLNVLVFGPISFTTTLLELKSYLKFNFSIGVNNLNINSIKKFDVILFHKNTAESKTNMKLINESKAIKILASNTTDKSYAYNSILKLPTTLNEINTIVESTSAKKIFTQNSSIKIKEYLLDKNEKKLIKSSVFITLTEKEIQLLELFINIKKPISKDKILSSVWHYASDVDTHTVETHIYRLRKKISNKFSDEKFILNNKDGYYL